MKINIYIYIYNDSEFSNDDTGRLILESILGTILEWILETFWSKGKFLGTILESILETFVCYLCVTFVLPLCYLCVTLLRSLYSACLPKGCQNCSKMEAKSVPGETMKTVLPCRRELTLALQAGCKNISF